MIIALEILKRYWGHLSLALAILLLLAVGKGCARQADLESQLQACLSKPPVVQYQKVTVAAKASQSVQIIYKNGSPCPDVLAVNDAETGASVAQGQENGLNAPSRPIQRGLFSFSAGAGVYQGGVYPALGGGIWTETALGSLGLEGQALFPMAWEESQRSRRPAFTVGLTIRP